MKKNLIIKIKNSKSCKSFSFILVLVLQSDWKSVVLDDDQFLFIHKQQNIQTSKYNEYRFSRSALYWAFREKNVWYKLTHEMLETNTFLER